MHIPRGPKLDRLIRFPVEWDGFYRRVGREGRLPELKEALLELPGSSVRDTRLSRILWWEGKRDEAKAICYQHRRCPLAKAWYFAHLVAEGDEANLRTITDSFRPTWSLGASTINLEARYRACLTLAIAATALKRQTLASEMQFEALQIAQQLRDPYAQEFIAYTLARESLFAGDFTAARGGFEQILRRTVPGDAFHDRALEYFTWLCWYQRELPSRLPLPEWAHKTLQAAWHRGQLDPAIEVPFAAGIPALLPIMGALRTLTQNWHVTLPLLHVKANRKAQQEWVDFIEAEVGQDVGEMIGFLSRSMLALAYSMNQQPEALSVLQTAFRWPTTGIPLMGMLYFANLIQVHANLPQLPKGPQVALAFGTLSRQFFNLPENQQIWLRGWMEDFCPVTLYLLHQHSRGRVPVPGSYVLVEQRGVMQLAGLGVPEYPRFFMTRHVVDLLSGWKVPRQSRLQAYRHAAALQSIGASHVIYQPIIKMMMDALH